MAKRQTTETKLAQLKELRNEPHASSAQEQLRKALADRSSYVAARAAEIIGEFEIRALAPDLLAAFNRFMIDRSSGSDEKAVPQRDPQCLAKTAIAEALVRIEHDDREFFRKWIHYSQPEPVWGGTQDSAAQLRGTCALGLVQSTCVDTISVLNHLAELLVDPEKPARVGVARAIAAFARLEGIPLLRLKIRMGDPAAEVTGECFASLLSLSAQESIPLIATYLQSSDPDIRLEAAAALGESKEKDAFLALKNCWESEHDPSFRKSLLFSMGLSRQPAAVDFLLSLVQVSPAELAADALAALAPCRYHAPTRERIAAAVQENGHASLKKAFEKMLAADRQ
jgi:HEAT repeat protein